jgi:hypothetical protein
VIKPEEHVEDDVTGAVVGAGVETTGAGVDTTGAVVVVVVHRVINVRGNLGSGEDVITFPTVCACV